MKEPYGTRERKERINRMNANAEEISAALQAKI
jgi:hypothetical protein